MLGATAIGYPELLILHLIVLLEECFHFIQRARIDFFQSFDVSMKLGVRRDADESVVLYPVNIPRQSRGLYDVSRSKRLKTPLAWLLASAGPAVASGNTGVPVLS